MRKGKSVLGKDVLSREDAAKLDTVKDLVIGPSNDEIVALLVDEGGLLASSRVVPADQVVSFGRDAIVVRGTASVIELSDHPEIAEIVRRPGKVLGIKVYTESGEDKGSVSDVYFDEHTHRIVGLEVGRGMLADVAQGPRFVPVDDIVRMGPDLLYIHEQAAADLDRQRGGVAGALADAGDKARDAAGSAGEKASQATASAREQLGTMGAGGSEKASQALVGRVAGRDVDDDTGSVLIPAGTRLTEEDVVLAREAGKLPDLATSVGLSETERAAAGIQDSLAAAGESVGSLWDRFTHKLGEMTDAGGQRVDEEQKKRRLTKIEDAVGRPVTKVFLDLEDRVILDLGDIITHAAIQRAHEAGTLDSLLDSAYKGEIQFTKEEMKVERRAEAAIDQAEAQGAGVGVMQDLRGEVESAQARRQAEKEQKQAQDEAARQEREQQRQESAKTREEKKQATANV